MKTVRTSVKTNALSFSKLIALMLKGDLSCHELAEETGLHYVTVLQQTRALYLAGACRIVRYDPDTRGRPCIKIYKIGKGPDCPRPCKPRAQISADYRRRKAERERAIALNQMMAGPTA